MKFTLRISIITIIVIFLAPFVCFISKASAEPIKFVFFHTGDIHGHMTPQPDPTIASEPRPLIGGYAAMATALFQEKRASLQEGALSLYLDGGDTFQGTPVVDITHGLCMIDAMNKLKVAFATIGNHDFDYGTAALASAAEKAQFPFIACNIFSKKTGRLLPFLRPFVIVAYKGVKMACIGVTTTDTAKISLPENVADLEFRDPIPILKDLVPKLRARGVNAVVLLSHIGMDADKKLADAVPDIDLILGAHSHTFMDKPVISEKLKVPIIHDGCECRVLGKVVFSIASGTKPDVEYSPLKLYIASYPEDPQIRRLVDEYQSEVASEMSEILATSGIDLPVGIVGGDSPAGSFIADAMRFSTRADFAAVNFGGVRSPIWKGPITKNDIFILQPFLNHVDLFTMSGAEIIELFEKSLSVDFLPVTEADIDYAAKNLHCKTSGLKRDFQGAYGYLVPSNLRITFDPRKPPMKRIVKITDDKGVPIDPKRTYKIALNSYLGIGGDGYTYLKRKKRMPTDMLVREAVENYLRTNKVLDEPPPIRMHNLALILEPFR